MPQLEKGTQAVKTQCSQKLKKKTTRKLQNRFGVHVRRVRLELNSRDRFYLR